MSDPIASIIASTVTQQESATAAAKQQQTPKRSFENVLNNTGGTPEAGAPQQTLPPDAAGNSSGARIERLRLDLMERTKRLPADREALDRMIPEMSDLSSRRDLLKEAMKGIKNPALAGNDFKSILSQIENRWLNVERIMTSDQSLSTGELLGLQARLYQVSQHVEVVSRVIDQVTGGIKTILNTNV